ncbi:FAD-dependent oxidoreductase [Rhodococcus sp. NPDC003318]|uniref:FAD-dependent oxidoreductase n=1 Tax=Rhodococcus sp. NPDC003318 TaxID=3364503 RepID=UPI0036BC0539
MPETTSARWDEIVDVVVVGSGVGALTAALLASDGGASVMVAEKAEYIGGTTATSGGEMWIPNNRYIADQDSREEAIAYISRLSDGRAADPKMIEVYVDTAPEALDYLESHTGYASRPSITPTFAMSDYYTVIPGRIPGGKIYPRTVAAESYPAQAELGEHAKLVHPSPWVQPQEIAFGESDISADELARRQREGYRAKGGGLIAPLLKALLDRGVEVRPSTPARRLVTDDDGAVIGVVIEADGAETRVGARRGVVLACGGFEWNPEMVKTYIGLDVKPVTPWANTGDGHRMAMAVGAKMGSMTTFFSHGVVYDPWLKGPDAKPLPQMTQGLGSGSIIVNQQGQRFMHGGYTYNDFSHPFGIFDQRDPGFPNKPPGWIVFGAKHVEKGLFGSSYVPGEDPALQGPDGTPSPGWLVVANSIRELAAKMNVDADALEETVTRYNKFAENGEDPDWGAPAQKSVMFGPDTLNHSPVEGPVYGAIQQWPGSIGTNGGCRIDADARVLGEDTPVIDGLYAAGNTSAAVLGGAYPGGGAAVGSSMVTGYLAGRHLAAKAPRDIGE